MTTKVAVRRQMVKGMAVPSRFVALAHISVHGTEIATWLQVHVTVQSELPLGSKNLLQSISDC